jgi:hypothetical protein
VFQINAVLRTPSYISIDRAVMRLRWPLIALRGRFGVFPRGRDVK